MCNDLMNVDGLVEKLREEVSVYDTIDDFAFDNHVSGVYIGQVLRKKQNPGPAILSILGFEKVIRYRSVRR